MRAPNQIISSKPSMLALYDSMIKAFPKMRDALQTVEKQVEHSKGLFSLGVSDELAKMLSSIEENPLPVLHEAQRQQAKEISDILDVIVINFFKTQKSVIHKVIKVNSEKTVNHYFIILKEEANDEARYPFIEFLIEYERESLSHFYEIVFQFLSPELEDGIDAEKIITL